MLKEIFCVACDYKPNDASENKYNYVSVDDTTKKVTLTICKSMAVKLWYVKDVKEDANYSLAKGVPAEIYD